jgi:hypothetical protein
MRGGARNPLPSVMTRPQRQASKDCHDLPYADAHRKGCELTEQTSRSGILYLRPLPAVQNGACRG